MINAKTKLEKRNIQNKLRVLRKGQGVTQEELAERIGCSRQALSNFEQGKTWSAEWEERYNIALGIEKKDPGEIPGGALPDQGETIDIQKMQELEQAQIQKAYELGKAEGEAETGGDEA